MDLLAIDRERCKKDGVCAAECPVAIIRLSTDDGFPELIDGGADICLRCGHCVAVCPHGALNHADVPLEACPPLDPALSITPAQAEQFLRSRRSFRFFRNRPVEKEALKRLIGIARYAPTASNAQLVEWLVITGQEKIRELAAEAVAWMRLVLKKDPTGGPAPYLPVLVAAWDMGYDAVLRGAPCLVVASAPSASANGMVDLTLSLSYFELMAPRLGLGTCWAGLLQGALLSWPTLRQMVGLPPDHSHHYPMMVGYPKHRYHRLPERSVPTIRWR